MPGTHPLSFSPWPSPTVAWSYQMQLHSKQKIKENKIVYILEHTHTKEVKFFLILSYIPYFKMTTAYEVIITLLGLRQEKLDHLALGYKLLLFRVSKIVFLNL